MVEPIKNIFVGFSSMAQLVCNKCGSKCTILGLLLNGPTRPGSLNVSMRCPKCVAGVLEVSHE